MSTTNLARANPASPGFAEVAAKDPFHPLYLPDPCTLHNCPSNSTSSGVPLRVHGYLFIKGREIPINKGSCKSDGQCREPGCKWKTKSDNLYSSRIHRGVKSLGITKISANGASHLFELTRPICQSLSSGASTTSGGKVFGVSHRFAATTSNTEVMMQEAMRRRVSSESETMYHRNGRYATNLPRDPNSVVYLQEIVPLPFRRPSANGKSLMNRWKMRAVKEVLCVNNNTSTAKQEHDINAEEAAEEAELWLSATSLLSAFSEASPMTLSPSSSFNASNRSWSLYNLPVTETLSLPANWRFYPEQEKAEQEEDASLITQRRGNAATPPLLSVTTEKASSSAAGPSTRSTQDDKNQINPPRRSSSPITSSPDEGDTLLMRIEKGYDKVANLE